MLIIFVLIDLSNEKKLLGNLLMRVHVFELKKMHCVSFIKNLDCTVIEATLIK